MVKNLWIALSEFVKMVPEKQIAFWQGIGTNKFTLELN